MMPSGLSPAQTPRHGEFANSETDIVGYEATFTAAAISRRVRRRIAPRRYCEGSFPLAEGAVFMRPRAATRGATN